MTQIKYYTYLGTNGTITSAIYLPDIYSIKKVRLMADFGMALTKDGKNFVDTVMIPIEEVNEWSEVKK